MSLIKRNFVPFVITAIALFVMSLETVTAGMTR